MTRAGTRKQPLKRDYVACDACRSRKVRCIIESQPPCLKCKREHRDCKFSRVSKTTKHRDLPKWATKSTQSATDSAAELDEVPLSGRAPLQGHQPTRRSQRDALRTPAISHGPTPPLRRDPGSHPGPATVPSDEQRRQTNPIAETANTSLSDKVIAAVVTGSHDALDVLSTAAGAQHHHTASAASHASPTRTPDLPTITPIEEHLGCHSGIGFRIQTLSEPTEETLDLWDKSRFVRQGLFTGQEAVSYVDL